MYWLALLALPSLVFALRPGVSPSRRVLAGGLVLLVPIVGLFLAVLVRRVRGGGIATEPPAEKPTRRLSAGDVARLGELPPVLDRLLAGDPGERLEALVALSGAGDAAAVQVLRWAVEHGPSEVVLDAALTLEEIDLRGEARFMAARAALSDSEEVELALAAGDAAAAPVLNRIADPAIAPALAEQARECYRIALACAPDRSLEIEVKMARLELAAGRPRAALEILDGMVGYEELRDEAAFRARAFEALSFSPSALEMPAQLAAHNLQNLPS